MLAGFIQAAATEKNYSARLSRKALLLQLRRLLDEKNHFLDEPNFPLSQGQEIRKALLEFKAKVESDEGKVKKPELPEFLSTFVLPERNTAALCNTWWQYWPQFTLGQQLGRVHAAAQPLDVYRLDSLNVDQWKDGNLQQGTVEPLKEEAIIVKTIETEQASTTEHVAIISEADKQQLLKKFSGMKYVPEQLLFEQLRNMISIRWPQQIVSLEEAQLKGEDFKRYQVLDNKVRRLDPKVLARYLYTLNQEQFFKPETIDASLLHAISHMQQRLVAHGYYDPAHMALMSSAEVKDFEEALAKQGLSYSVLVDYVRLGDLQQQDEDLKVSRLKARSEIDAARWSRVKSYLKEQGFEAQTITRKVPLDSGRFLRLQHASDTPSYTYEQIKKMVDDLAQKSEADFFESSEKSDRKQVALTRDGIDQSIRSIMQEPIYARHLPGFSVQASSRAEVVLPPSFTQGLINVLPIAEHSAQVVPSPSSTLMPSEWLQAFTQALQNPKWSDHHLRQFLLQVRDIQLQYWTSPSCGLTRKEALALLPDLFKHQPKHLSREGIAIELMLLSQTCLGERPEQRISLALVDAKRYQKNTIRLPGLLQEILKTDDTNQHQTQLVHLLTASQRYLFEPPCLPLETGLQLRSTVLKCLSTISLHSDANAVALHETVRALVEEAKQASQPLNGPLSPVLTVGQKEYLDLLIAQADYEALSKALAAMLSQRLATVVGESQTALAQHPKLQDWIAEFKNENKRKEALALLDMVSSVPAWVLNSSEQPLNRIFDGDYVVPALYGMQKALLENRVDIARRMCQELAWGILHHPEAYSQHHFSFYNFLKLQQAVVKSDYDSALEILNREFGGLFENTITLTSSTGNQGNASAVPQALYEKVWLGCRLYDNDLEPMPILLREVAQRCHIQAEDLEKLLGNLFGLPLQHELMHDHRVILAIFDYLKSHTIASLQTELHQLAYAADAPLLLQPERIIYQAKKLGLHEGGENANHWLQARLEARGLSEEISRKLVAYCTKEKQLSLLAHCPVYLADILQTRLENGSPTLDQYKQAADWRARTGLPETAVSRQDVSFLKQAQGQTDLQAKLLEDILRVGGVNPNLLYTAVRGKVDTSQRDPALLPAESSLLTHSSNVERIISQGVNAMSEPAVMTGHGILAASSLLAEAGKFSVAAVRDLSTPVASFEAQLATMLTALPDIAKVPRAQVCRLDAALQKGDEPLRQVSEALIERFKWSPDATKRLEFAWQGLQQIDSNLAAWAFQAIGKTDDPTLKWQVKLRDCVAGDGIDAQAFDRIIAGLFIRQAQQHLSHEATGAISRFEHKQGQRSQLTRLIEHAEKVMSRLEERQFQAFKLRQVIQRLYELQKELDECKGVTHSWYEQLVGGKVAPNYIRKQMIEDLEALHEQQAGKVFMAWANVSTLSEVVNQMQATLPHLNFQATYRAGGCCDLVMKPAPNSPGVEMKLQLSRKYGMSISEGQLMQGDQVNILAVMQMLRAYYAAGSISPMKCSTRNVQVLMTIVKAVEKLQENMRLSHPDIAKYMMVVLTPEQYQQVCRVYQGKLLPPVIATSATAAVALGDAKLYHNAIPVAEAVGVTSGQRQALQNYMAEMMRDAHASVKNKPVPSSSKPQSLQDLKLPPGVNFPQA